MNVMRKIVWMMVGLVVVSLFSANLDAQSNTIYFRYVTNNAETSTELILTNVSNRDATVTLDAYREEGDPALQISVQVPARSSLVMGGNSFAGVQGWVLGSSNVPGVLGNL